MYKKFCILSLIALVLASCAGKMPPCETEIQLCATINPELSLLSKGEDAGTEEVVADCALLQAWQGEVRAANVVQSINSGTTQINFSGVRLVERETYDIYIWVGCAGYYDTDDLRRVKLKEDNDGKSPQFDAFCAYTNVTCSRDVVIHPVTLKRPFAKLNFTAPVDSVTKISFTAPTGLDLKTGMVLSDTKAIEYTVQQETSNVTAFDYIFANEGVTEMDYTFKLGADEAITTTIPVARNKKTNIILR